MYVHAKVEGREGEGEKLRSWGKTEVGVKNRGSGEKEKGE